tara:strand:+ start:98 stop:823 length:726 start_codon:yes stop_codon:yes gene_type:complete
MSIMQLVKKKKGKKRPGYRGEGAYQGGATNQGGAGPAGGASSGGNYGGGNGGGNNFSNVTAGTLSDPREKQDVFTQSYKEPGLFGFGGGYRDLRVDSDTSQGFKKGIGSTILGGILSLINPALGLAFRGVNFLRDKVPQTFQNFRSSNTLEEFRDKMRGYGRTMPIISTNPAFGGIESLGVFDDDDEEDIIIPRAKPTIPSLSDELMDFEQGQTISPLQARDGGRIKYMNGGLTDLVDIYD